jgi:hypothetical protein
MRGARQTKNTPSPSRRGEVRESGARTQARRKMDHAMIRRLEVVQQLPNNLDHRIIW